MATQGFFQLFDISLFHVFRSGVAKEWFDLKMQFSIRNLYYVVWLQKNHMESLTSGVEPFILCAEFLNVDISKIAVMATLTVNLLSPCNVISSVALFHFRARRPALGYGGGPGWCREEQAGRERVELQSFPFLPGWDGASGIPVLKSSVLLRRTVASAWGQESVGHEDGHQ